MPAPIRPDLDIMDSAVLGDVVNGALRIAPEQALRLFRDMPLTQLGRWADARCRVVHGDHVRTSVIDRNINYTNYCTARCRFCAFYLPETSPHGYVLTWEEMRDLEAEAPVAILPVGAIEAHGPHLPLDTDVIIAEAMARSGAAKLAEGGAHAVLLPSLSYTAAGFAAAAEKIAKDIAENILER